jgi:hypothetical protein
LLDPDGSLVAESRFAQIVAQRLRRRLPRCSALRKMNHRQGHPAVAASKRGRWPHTPDPDAARTITGNSEPPAQLGVRTSGRSNFGLGSHRGGNLPYVLLQRHNSAPFIVALVPTAPRDWAEPAHHRSRRGEPDKRIVTGSGTVRAMGWCSDVPVCLPPTAVSGWADALRTTWPLTLRVRGHVAARRWTFRRAWVMLPQLRASRLRVPGYRCDPDFLTGLGSTSPGRAGPLMKICS